MLLSFSYLFFSFIFISWRLITLQYCSGFCHTLTWISHGFTCVPHPEPPSHLLPHPILLGHPSPPEEKTLESPLDSKEIKLVNPKENQPWIFTGRTDAEAEAPILWPSDAKSWFIRKDPDAGKYWGQGEKGVTEDKMVGWHHWHNGYEFEQTLGDSEEQRSLVCCSSWGWKKSNMTFLITWTHG